MGLQTWEQTAGRGFMAALEQRKSDDSNHVVLAWKWQYTVPLSSAGLVSGGEQHCDQVDEGPRGS